MRNVLFAGLALAGAFHTPVSAAGMSQGAVVFVADPGDHDRDGDRGWNRGRGNAEFSVRTEPQRWDRDDRHNNGNGWGNGRRDRDDWRSARPRDNRYHDSRYADWYYGRDHRDNRNYYTRDRSWYQRGGGWDQRWSGGIWLGNAWLGWDDPFLPRGYSGWSSYAWNPPRDAWGGRTCHRIVERDLVRGRPAFVSYRVCVDAWGRRVTSDPRFERWAY